MASLPQQSPDLKRQRSSEASSASAQEGTSSSQVHRRSSIPQSLDSEDSQTVLLDPPPSSKPPPTVEQGQEPTSQKPKLERSQTSKEPRKCWICFADDTEDTPTTSRWRSPCPCALKAHEACLLDWIADLENPSSQPRPIKCPQCKSQLVVRRPLSVITPLVIAAQNSALKLTFPCVVASLAGTIVAGLWLHGFSTIYIVFGHEDANRLLGLDVLSSKLDNNWGFGMPLIPLGLIASRTSGPNTEHMLALLPASYFYVCRDGLASWPPSSATALAVLGWVQLAYKQLYRRYLTPLEQKWLKELKPRAGENRTEENREGDVEHREEGDGMQLGFELQIEVQEEEVEEGVADNEQHHPEQPPGDAAAQVDEVAGHVDAGEQQPPAAGAPAPPQDRWEHFLDINIIGVVQKAMGALLFPSIAATMGQGLKMVLPRTWTTPPIRGLDKYPAGFLQSRFGRTIIGGCLFVVLKDALQFYSVYQLATSHKHRRVLDYDEIPQRIRKRLNE